MKNYKHLTLFSIALLLAFTSCHDLEELNVNPNSPEKVTTPMLMLGAQKRTMDFIYDAWFSGRQALLYPQYWSQRNYTEEDLYQIRDGVNNNYFNHLYRNAYNFAHIEELNTDEDTKAEAAVYGSNDNQIAVSKILRTWLIQIIADTWGGVPYSEGFNLEEQSYPKYDDLDEIYYAMIDELDKAIALIKENETAFTSGDNIYNGDASKWKKFANSLKARIAVRLSKVDPDWKSYIAEAVQSGVFESNSDNAVFGYSASDPNQCEFYRAYFTGDQRNDFTIARPFTNLLQGIADTKNGKSHPWTGIVDPRLKIYTSARDDRYNGLLYGVPSDNQTAPMRTAAPDFQASPPVVIKPNFAVPLMTYSEMCFILCEYENFSSTRYEEGIRASIEYWNDMNVNIQGASSLESSEIENYITVVSGAVNAETVATQKYIHLYMDGTTAWAEYRRTGYPATLQLPGSIIQGSGEFGDDLSFVPLSETKGDIPARVPYPTNESTINNESFYEAVKKLEDGTNNYYSKMFWDVRTTTNPHPANK